MIKFDAAQKALYYPEDRRFRIWIKPSFVVAAVCLALIPLMVAWVQAAVFGLPYLPFRGGPLTSPSEKQPGSIMNTALYPASAGFVRPNKRSLPELFRKMKEQP